jgi:hypothetical protein
MNGKSRSGSASVGTTLASSPATTIATPATPGEKATLATGAGSAAAVAAAGGGGGGGLFAEGPTKFAKLTASISAFTTRIKAAQEELEKASTFTKDLETQCSIQERQCVQLEEEQRAVSDEVGGLVGKIEAMLVEKAKIEAKYEELKAENTNLEALIKQDEAAFASGSSY